MQQLEATKERSFRSRTESRGTRVVQEFIFVSISRKHSPPHW